MDFAADFTAIDFETANRRRDSACQLAAVVVRAGRIVDQAMWMIRPEPLSFSPGNIRIHGITPDQVRGEPVFGELWDSIRQKLDGECLVAHNASFDIGVLIACLRSHGCEIPEMQYSCTRAVARRAWPHRPRFGLKPLAEWLGIRFRHHDALEDSIACAKILLAAGIDTQADSMESLEKRLRLSRGRAGEWGFRGPTASRGSGTRRSAKASITRTAVALDGDSPLPFWMPGTSATPESASVVQSTTASYRVESSGGGLAAVTSEADLQRLMIRGEFIRPLRGKRVVVSARLRMLQPAQASRLAVRWGASCHDAIDDSIDVLVVAEPAAKCPLWAEAQAMNQRGGSIRILDEQAFTGLVVT